MWRWFPLLALWGCEAPPDDPDPTDTSTAWVEAGDFELLLGTGETSFTPFGAEGHLFRGAQGSQHLWVSLRASGIPTGRFHLTLEARRTSDGLPVGGPSSVGLALEPREAGTIGLEGYALVVGSPEEALGQEVRVDVEATALTGEVGRASEQVVLEWGPGEPSNL